MGCSEIRATARVARGRRNVFFMIHIFVVYGVLSFSACGQERSIWHHATSMVTEHCLACAPATDRSWPL